MTNEQNISIKKYDLEDRLVNFTCDMIEIVEALPNNRAGNYIASQLTRACHSPTFNYGEAQGAESQKDFVHKLGVVLKELKECRVALKIINKKGYLAQLPLMDKVNQENAELIAIIAKSTVTAKKNLVA